MSKKYLMTQSLLSSWLYMYDCYECEETNAYEEFLRVLNRIRTETNENMQNGIDFENAVVNYCNGEETQSKVFHDTYKDVAEIVKGGQFQVAAYRNRTIAGIEFLLYGRCDCVKAGTIYDIKFSKGYEVGKYLNSPQHPMYFECVPTAHKFSYLVSNGTEVSVETYTREETASIDGLIKNFVRYLEDANLLSLYMDKWEAS